MTITKASIGFLAAGIAPESIGPSARRVEELGFAEFWVPEDYYENGAFTAASLALAATERLTVGIGVLSVLSRHPAVIAMEAGTLARAFPGRLVLGLGTGLTQSIADLGLAPRSPLGAVRESLEALRELLGGATVVGDRGTHHFGSTRLADPPGTPPPLAVGGLGPKMMELAGEVADSVILSSLSSPAYVRWARQAIESGAERAGRTNAPDIRDFAWLSIGQDRDVAREAIRASVAGALGFVGPGPLTDADGYSDHLARWLSEGGASMVAERVPLDWTDRLTVTGAAVDCERAIRERLDAGATRVILCPTPGPRFDDMLEFFAAHVTPDA